MNNNERSLLLFFESCMVDSTCKVDGRRMNSGDFDIARHWADRGYIQFGRLKTCDISVTSSNHYSHYVLLSSEALSAAHRERLARASRMIRRFADGLCGEYPFDIDALREKAL